MARSIGFVLFTGVLCIGTAICPGVEITWDKGATGIVTPVTPPYPGDGFWTSGENWRANNTDPQGSPPNDVAPGPGDRANIGLHDQWAQIDAPATITVGDNITVSSIRLGTNPGLGVGGHGKLIIDGGALNVLDTGTGDHFLIGADNNRTGHLIISAGTVTVVDTNRRIVLGWGANTNTVGIVDFFGGEITSNGGLFVGGDDPNANRANTQGTFTMGALGDPLTAQTLNTRTSNLEVGRGGTGTFTQNSGTVTIETNNLILGQGAASDGTYTMGGGKLEAVLGQIRVGNTGKGTFQQNAGDVIVKTTLDLGNVNNANSDGTYNMAGGTLTTGDNIFVGNEQKGTFTVTGGTIDVGNRLLIGRNATGVGTMTIDGTSTVVNLLGSPASGDRFSVVGNNGKGTLNLLRGTLNAQKGLRLAQTVNAVGANAAEMVIGTLGGNDADTVLNVSGGNFEAAQNGQGTVTVNSGTFNQLTNNLVVGQNASSVAMFTINGGLLKTLDSSGDAGHLRIGNNGPGTFVQTGGTVDVITQVELGTNDVAGAEGSYTLAGGTLVIGTGMRVGCQRKGTFNFEDGTLQWKSGSLYIGGHESTAPNADGTFNLGATGLAPTMSIRQLEVGRHGLGVFNQTSGDVTVTNANLVVSQYATSNGTYNLTDGTVNTVPGGNNGDLNFNEGTGAFNQDGGTVSIGRDINFSNGSGTSTYNLTGGTLNVARDIKSRSGTSTLIVDGGTLNVGTGNINVTTFHLSPTTNATYTHSQGTLAATNLLLGDAAKGTFTQDGGTVNVGADLVFGPNLNKGGTYNLNAGTLNVAGDIRERHKDVDTAQFHLDGGTLNVTGDIITQRFALGQAAGKTGVYTLASGKNLTATGTLAVGSGGTGDLTVDGGTLVADNSYIGEAANGDGTLTINSGSVTFNGFVRLGNSGIGRINLIDGSLTVTAGGLHLAETTNANAEGILTIGDGTTSPVLSVSGHNFETANNGKGTVTMNSGTFNQLTNNIIVGQGPNSNATFTLNDGLIDIENQLRVGNKGTGLFVQNGGTVNVGTALDLANDGNNDADATYTMTGGALNVGDRVASELVIGNANRAGSTAMFEMIDGTLTTSKGIRIANTGANSSGKMIVGDGSTSPTITINGGNFETADNGTGEVLFNSGTLTLNRNNLMIGQAANSQATFTMNGGLIDLRPAFAAVADHGRLRTNAGTGVFTLNDGTVHVGNDLDLSNNNAGGLTLNINGGEMIVGLHVNYRNNGTDTINLAGGLLDLTGGNVNFATGTADFNFTGGRLQDVGTFGSTLVQGGGTLAPGQMAPGQVAGTMAMTGGYTQNAGVLEIEIGGLDQGNEYDFVDVSGTANLDASLQVLLTGGFDPQLGDSFDVLTAANVNLLAGFTLDQSLLDPSQQYFAYRVIPGGNGQILRLQLVPEPSTIVTAGLGLMALIGLGWRRRRRIAP